MQKSSKTSSNHTKTSDTTLTADANKSANVKTSLQKIN